MNNDFPTYCLFMLLLKKGGINLPFYPAEAIISPSYPIAFIIYEIYLQTLDFQNHKIKVFNSLTSDPMFSVKHFLVVKDGIVMKTKDNHTKI